MTILGFEVNHAELVRWGWAIAKPVLSIIVWWFCDLALRHIHKKSHFIDKLFSRQLSAANPAEREALEHRIGTFRGLFSDVARILCALFFLFLTLEAVGIDIKPLLAGVGVVGIGLSLAAQNILRDFLNGLFILSENQYNIGDYIYANGEEGTVEEFSLRTTKLRALSGRLIIIPNSQIAQVANDTKGYSVALVTLGVPYDTDVPRALAAMDRAARAVREENTDVVTGEPVTQGITQFDASDIKLRVHMRTLPGAHWEIERRVRMRIKEEFAKDGIGTPYQRIVCETADRREAAA